MNAKSKATEITIQQQIDSVRGGDSTASRLVVGIVLCVGATVASAPSFASNSDLMNVFSRAIVDGAASAPVPDLPEFKNAIKVVETRTGSDAPLVIYARRVIRFSHQPRCGRVVFIIGQPATHTAWKDMGGQLNICDNGDPPLRMCKSAPNKLVPFDAACAGGASPVDTPEVSAAIHEAVSEGSVTPQTFYERHQAQRAAAQDTPASQTKATQ